MADLICRGDRQGFIEIARFDGTRAVQQLKQVLSTLRMFLPFEAMPIPFHTQFMDEDGRLQPNEIMETAATAMLDELLRTSLALAPLREPVAAA